MQDKETKLVSWAESVFLTCDTLLSHTCFQPVIPTSTPCKLSLIPCRSDPCQARVTFGGLGYYAVHTHTHIYAILVVYLFIRVGLFSGVCFHPVRLFLSAPNTPLLSQSDVLSFDLPPLAAPLWRAPRTQRCRLPPVRRATVYSR